VIGAEMMQPGFTARTSNTPLLEDAIVRAANRTAAEEAKKKKDEEKARKAKREKVKVDRRKWHHGSEGEEDKEEESDDEEEDDEDKEDDGAEWDVVIEPINYTKLSKKITTGADNLANLSPYNPIVRETTMDFNLTNIQTKIVQV
jgi:TATA-binding protein-associated factor Taf7